MFTSLPLSAMRSETACDARRHHRPHLGGHHEVDLREQTAHAGRKRRAQFAWASLIASQSAETTNAP